MTVLSELVTTAHQRYKERIATTRLVPIGGDFNECISARGPVLKGTFGCITFCLDNEKIFGFANPNKEDSLYKQTKQVFCDFLALMQEKEMTYLWRVWNFIPEITKKENGVERYHDFNKARYNAFVEAGYSCESGASASTAVGSEANELSIFFLAGKTAPINIENPRQVSAYEYPKIYGVVAPVFSRASLINTTNGQAFFISGTASIVGAETIGAGNITTQVYETLLNIETLINEVNKVSASVFDFNSFTYKVYLRNLTNFAAVKSILDTILPQAEVVYAKANICRKNLLVEIEATSTNILTINK